MCNKAKAMTVYRNVSITWGNEQVALSNEEWLDSEKSNADVYIIFITPLESLDNSLNLLEDQFKAAADEKREDDYDDYDNDDNDNDDDDGEEREGQAKEKERQEEEEKEERKWW